MEISVIEALYNNQFAPSTLESGFIDGSAAQIAREFIDWQTKIHQPRNVTLEGCEFIEPLSSLLNRLAPLTRVERRRYLFVPTDSRWTAYFDSGHQGTDAASTIATLCELYNHEGFRVVNSPHIEPVKSGKGNYGAVILEKYGPVGLPILNTERAIYAAHNGSRWEFGCTGEPFAFECVEAYKARKVQDRFTPELLNSYLMQFEINAFDPYFYRSDRTNSAVLVEKSGPYVTGYAEFTFAELAINFD